MSSPAAEHQLPVENAELQQALSEIFTVRDCGRHGMTHWERRPSVYHSSFPLEELTIWFEDGEPLKLIFKNLNPRALSAAARVAKPEFLDDPLREIELYRSLLDSCQLGTAFCYGSVVDVPAEQYWLFLEEVEGRELYQVGEFEIWRQTARWLARLHSRFAAPDCLPQPVTAREAGQIRDASHEVRGQPLPAASGRGVCRSKHGPGGREDASAAGGDPGSGTGPGAQVTLRLQLGVALLHQATGQAELARQLTRGRQPFRGRQAAGPDRRP